MAKHKRSTLFDVERTDSYWGYALEGNRDALIDSAEVCPEWMEFGSDKDHRGRTVRTRKLCRLDRRKVTIKDIGRGRFDVRVFFTADEAGQQRRLHEESVRREAEERYEQGRKEREPKTRDEFRWRADEIVDFAFRYIQHYIGEGEGGFRFDTATAEECAKARTTLVGAMKHGRVIDDGRERRPALRLIRCGDMPAPEA